MRHAVEERIQDPSVPDSTLISRGGYTVVTTFRQSWMQAAAGVVRQNQATLDPHNAADQNVHIGIATVDTTTGAVLGFYGGSDYVKRGYNDARWRSTWTPRSPTARRTARWPA